VALARQDLRALEDGITVEATAAVTDHRAAREQVAAKNQSVEAARRYYNDQHALMLAGAATPNDVLLAENELRRAELEWIDAFIHARVASAALLKVQGQTGLTKAAGNAP
jgi:outer membrane protein TolC